MRSHCRPPFAKSTRRMGHPRFSGAERNQKPGPPARLAGRSLRHFRSCLFPQPSTIKIPLLVTNKLDREFQKAQAHYMREGSPNPSLTTGLLNGSQSAVKSLFWNTLQISPCGSGFYAEPDPINNRQVIQNQYFTKPNEKVGTDRAETKSLFWNILRVTPCGSRFCADSTLSLPTKSLRMNTLEKGTEKSRGYP